MNFTKNKRTLTIVAFIIFAVYNAISFVLPFDRHFGFWVAYSFTILAILLSTGVGLFVIGQEGLKSKFYGIPLVYVTWSYLIAQVVIGFIEMILPSDFYRYEIILNVIILAICLIGLIVANTVKDEIEQIDEKIKEKVFFIKALQIDIEGTIVQAPTEAARKALNALAETIKYSDPMSSPQLAAIENRIEAKVFALKESISDSDTVSAFCDELQQLFAERNSKCRLLK